jgi:hypothetical protein
MEKNRNNKVIFKKTANQTTIKEGREVIKLLETKLQILMLFHQI